MPARTKVVVAGGGWAGLSAAVELTSHGVPVTLLESARQLGGRARSAPFGNLPVDNGQHLFIGAYREMLRLMEVIGVPENTAFLRLPLELQLRSGEARFALRAPDLVAPLHLAAALIRAEGLSLAERVASLRFSASLLLSGFKLPRDISVAELLARHRQPPRLVEWLWAPLCLATLNVAPNEASARVFLRVLRDAFTKATRDSDLLFPRADLDRVFPLPASHFLESRGATVRLGERVTGLRVESGAVTGLVLENGALDASHVVLALPPGISGSLLQAHPAASSLAANLRRFDHTPIATVYLRYPHAVQLESPMVGLTGTLAQWVFNRDLCDQPGVVAAVMSGTGPHMEMDREALATQVANELSTQFGWPAPEETFVVREKRATFRCGVEIDDVRPQAPTPIAGLWLAGDYTATGYPATLEGAVRSGVQCARLILAELGRTPSGTPS